MSGSFLLELDTTAPAVTLTAQEVVQGQQITASLAVDENASVAARAVATDGTEYVGTLSGSDIVIALHGTPWPGGYLVVAAEDDVGNSAETSFFIGAAGPVKVFENITSTFGRAARRGRWFSGATDGPDDWTIGAWVPKRR